MEKSIQNFITQQNLFSKSDKILVGISGGRDSVSLSLVLKNLNYNIALAHCNFSLRGDESDEDEKFVEDFSKNQNLDLYKTTFNTTSYAKEKKISIQMAARELRYNWFEKLKSEHQFNFIAIAHNSDDIIETFFINLIRGTGIEGLSGIHAQNGSIVRPMLNISRATIDKYISKNNISFREDSSNASTKYIRNKLRHNIIPEFTNISGSFKQTMIENIRKIENTNQVYKNEIAFKKSKIFIELSDKIKIDIERLKELKPLSSYLYEFLKPYGFSSGTIEDIARSLNAESGKRFFSKTHQIIKDRDHLILTPINKREQHEVFLGKEEQEIHEPIHLNIEITDRKQFEIPKSNLITALDIDKLSFPLILRNWKQGDYFMPLGMNRMKKISDFLIDTKVSIVDKENTYVIQSKNDIVAIIGKRIDDRYKITDETLNVLKISYLK